MVPCAPSFPMRNWSHISLVFLNDRGFVMAAELSLYIYNVAIHIYTGMYIHCAYVAMVTLQSSFFVGLKVIHT